MKKIAAALLCCVAVTLTQAQTYVQKPGSLYQSFDDVSAWTVPVGSRVADSQHVQQGSASLTLSEGSGYSAHAYKPISTDFSNVSTISFWIYAQYPVNDNGWHACSLYLTSDNFQDYWIATSQKLRPGWSKITFSKSDFQANGAPNWTSPMTLLQMGLFSDTNDGFSASFDNMTLNEYSRPKVMIAFDDDYASSYSFGYEYLKNYGLVGTEFVISSTVDGAGRTTSAQLQEMYNYGWDMCNHTTTHPDLRTLTQAQIQAEYQTCEQFLISKGWTRNNGYLHLAYPTGHFNQTVLDADAAMGLITARTTMETQQADQVDSKFLLYSLVPDSTSNNAAQIIAGVDQSVSNGTALILTFHNITPTPQVAIDWSDAAFRSIIDHVASLKSQGLIDVVTVPQWYNGLQQSNSNGTTLTGIKTSALSNAAGIDNTGTVFISAAANTATNVNLSVNSSAVQVPSFVSVPPSSTSGSFTITSTWVNSSTTVALTGSLNGVSYTCTFTVLPKAPNQILLDSASTRAGTTIQGHVWLNAPTPSGGATVWLWTDSSQISVPASTSIPAGWFHADFSITAQNRARTGAAHVFAQYNGATISVPITITR